MSLNITESYKVAVISTSHVIQADSEILPTICYDPITDRGHNWILVLVKLIRTLFYQSSVHSVPGGSSPLALRKKFSFREN